MELDRLLRIAEVLRITGVSTATLYRWIKDGTFPAPVRLGTNSVGWRESAIRDWLESREPAGSPPAAGLDEAPEARADKRKLAPGGRLVNRVSRKPARRSGRAP